MLASETVDHKSRTKTVSDMQNFPPWSEKMHKYSDIQDSYGTPSKKLFHSGSLQLSNFPEQQYLWPVWSFGT